MFSRSLIKDPGGTPITLTIAAFEYLNVSYEFRMYPNLVDATLSATVLSVGYTVTVRPSNAGNSSYWSASSLIGGVGLPAPLACYAYTGVIAAVPGSAIGTATQLPNTVFAWNAAYVAGTFTRTWTATMPPNDGNVAGGINTIIITNSSYSSFQFGISPVFPKDNTKTMTFSCAFSLVAI
jgi:hypothetical protein